MVKAYEYDIQRKLTYAGIGGIIAAPFTRGLSLLASAGIYLGKAGRYVRREFDEDFSKDYPLERSPKNNYLQKIGNALKNFFRGFKKEYTEKSNYYVDSEEKDYEDRDDEKGKKTIETIIKEDGKVTKVKRFSNLDEALAYS